MHGVVEYDISPIRGPLANAFVILINVLFFNIKLIGLYDVYPRDYSQKLLNVPGLFTTLIGSKEDWTFLMETEAKACKAYSDQRCTISRGKVLGGTSTINNLLYIRGLPEDYEKSGIETWNSEITTKIFEKMEGNESAPLRSLFSDAWLHLNFTNYTGTPKHVLEAAYLRTGYRRLPIRHAIGVVDHLTMKNNGARINMAQSFLTPIKERPNLFFTKTTEVEAIGITEAVDKRANGVNVSINGVRFFLRARKEVILTAGAINNAKLLLMSGLGSRSYLVSKNLPFHANLPGIAKNLLLRPTVPLYVAIEPCCSVCHREYYQEEDLIKDCFDYIMYKSGSWSHTNINSFVAYILTRKLGTSLPNIAVHHMYFKIGDRNLNAWVDAMNYHPKITNSLLNFNKERAIILFMVELLNPLSRGEVLLNETHFLSNPIVKGNFFTDDENWDFDTLYSGFSFITNLTEIEALAKDKAEFLDLDLPNCRNFKFCTPTYVKCYIQNMVFPRSDIGGTAKMGPECDHNAVVKENLEVRSVRCLRVADSSVLNFLPVGNTVATDAMIGYNLGEILKEKWLKNYTSIFRS
ncbi:glucose dehydrogenase [FAD, quinone] isoform X2 [Leptinotarsa decemlineata]|uniref:glucose dehydrogenase [FAD, quinone] isoform X2 n=1 Tax=Leptinotarsa decemlineata TaxID=7539 RepID=UPI000C2533B8|nr:glucose dehydrogenase [FAD, quinone]-like isoform X2 [Leptinotarsa decemlineata]